MVQVTQGVGIFAGTQSVKYDDGTAIRTPSDWIPYATKAGRTVYKSVLGYGDKDIAQYLIPWKRLDGSVQAFKTPLVLQVSTFLADPAGWDAAQEKRVIDAAAKGSIFHSIIKSVAKAGSQLIAVDKDIYGTVLHPVTISDGGLALSHQTTTLLDHAGVPPSVVDAAQLVTKLAGYGVAAGAVVTAAGGIGATTDFISSGASTVGSVVGAAETGKQVYDVANGLLHPAPTGTVAVPYELPPEQSNTGLLIAAGIVAVVGLIIFSQR